MKVKLGPIIGQASGSIGGMTASHNRAGTYMRRRAIPVNPQSVKQLLVRANLTANSQAWRGLASDIRLAWANYAQENPYVDRLGDKHILTGAQIYNALNNRLRYIPSAVISAPPTVAAPAPLTSLSATFDVGAGAYALTFTVTPQPANTRLHILAAVTDSAAVNYVKNIWRLLPITAAAVATGIDLQTQTEAIFGALTVGRRVTYRVATFSDATGLLGAALEVSGVVIST